MILEVQMNTGMSGHSRTQKMRQKKTGGERRSEGSGEGERGERERGRGRKDGGVNNLWLGLDLGAEGIGEEVDLLAVVELS